MIKELTFKPEAIVKLLKEKGEKVNFQKGEYVFHPEILRGMYTVWMKGRFSSAGCREDGRK